MVALETFHEGGGLELGLNQYGREGEYVVSSDIM